VLRSKPSDRVVEHLAAGLAHLDDSSAVPALLESARGDVDPFLKSALAEAVLALRNPEGFLVLIDVVAGDAPVVSKSEAEKTLAKAGAPVKDVQALRSWWETRGRNLKWRESTKRFD
jgi:hypothetical protein